MSRRTDSYWERRSRQRMASYHRSAETTIITITTAYDKAIRDIQDEIEKIFRTFGKNGQMDPDKAQKVLNQYIPNPLLGLAKKIYHRLKNDRVRRWLLSKMNAPAYRARITRLQALKEQIYLQSKIIADAEIRESTAGYVNTIRTAYYRTMFDLQRGLGVGFEFAAMPQRTIETILKRPWSGEHFSSRVWANTDELAKRLSQVITAGFMSGIGLKKMVREIEDLSDMGKHAAGRLVRTETTYMANAAEIESYEEAEIERYMFVATLDLRTSPQCRSHDRKVYSVKEAVPGQNMPPLHPYCRSTTRAYFDEDTLKNIQRRARDPETGKTYLVPADMSYEQWRKSIADKHGRSVVEVLEKQIRNKAADQKQYSQYKAVLGKDALKSFAAFQDLKYTDSENWNLTQLDYLRRRRLIEQPELALPYANQASAADEKFTKYLFNPENKQGIAKGAAFTSRLGYTADNWEELREQITRRSPLYPAKLKHSDQYGDRYEQKMIVRGPNGNLANVVVGWNVVDGKTKMTSAYIKEVRGRNED